MNDKDILIHGRRLHNILRNAIEDGDGQKGQSQWEDEERPGFEHYSCGMYLASILAFLAGQHGEKCWNKDGKEYSDLKEFMNNCPHRRYKELEISASKLDALHEVRNAIIHNSGNVRENNNKNSEKIIREAAIQGVNLNPENGYITLVSNNDIDFMEWVRVAFLCITEYHGDWGGPSKWK